MYTVKEMVMGDFTDFKLVSSRFANTNIDSERQKVRWLDIRKYVVGKDEPNKVKVFYSLEATPVEMNLNQKITKRSAELTANFDPTNAYLMPLEVTADKYKDLQELCSREIIPQAHHSFYSSLPRSEQTESDDDENEL